MKSLSVTTQMKATEHNFLVALFVMLCKAVQGGSNFSVQ